MKIKDLPLEARPREKAFKYGIDVLSDEELLAIILGNGTKECNVIQLATNVLSFTGGLNGLMRSNYQSLKKINGIKLAKALSLASMITIFQRVDLFKSSNTDETIEKILEKHEKRLLVDHQEKVILVTLSRYEQIAKETILAVGSDKEVTISAREIFKEVYLNNGYGFYLLHTHPNSSSYPSHHDLINTQIILEKSKKIGLKFKDHYIVGLDGWTSIFGFLKKN